MASKLSKTVKQMVTSKRASKASRGLGHGISPKAADLLHKILKMPDRKDQASRELDEWVTSTGKFSTAYVKQALQVLEHEKHWSKIIQVSEWMLQKGEGKTLRTYEVLLKALDMDNHAEEAEAVWKKDVVAKPWSVPTRLVSYALAMFERHQKPMEIIKLFTKMEQSGRNLDEESIRRVAKAYEEEGFLEMKKHVLQKYKLPL